MFVCHSAQGQPFVSLGVGGDPQTRCVPTPWVTLGDEAQETTRDSRPGLLPKASATSVTRSLSTQTGPGVPSLSPGKVGRVDFNPSPGRKSSLADETAGSERLSYRCSSPRS